MPPFGGSPSGSSRNISTWGPCAESARARGLTGAAWLLSDDGGREEGWGLLESGLEAAGEADLALLWVVAPTKQARG